MLICPDIDCALLLMALLGLTLPGKGVVAYNYLMEFTMEEYRKFTITMINIMEALAMFFVLFSYEKLYQNYLGA